MESCEKTTVRRNVKGEDKLEQFLQKRQSEESVDCTDSEDVKKTQLRRINSISTAEGIRSEDIKKRHYQPDKPIHKPRDSLLSWSSGFNNYEGVINWGFLVLLIGGCRLFLENVIKYGFRVNPFDWALWLLQESRRDNHYHTPLWLLASNFNFLFAFQLEKWLSKGKVPSWLGFHLHACHLAIIVATPVVVFAVWPDLFSLLGRMVICTMHILMFLKLWSYVQVNHWCRDDMYSRRKTLRGRSQSFRHFSEEKFMNAIDAEDYLVSRPSSSSEKVVRYPNNLTLGDLYYFLAAPTLCYELNFPRTSRIRKLFLFRRAAEVLVFSNLLIALFQQWMIPSVKNSFKPFSEMDFFRTWERLLKLSIPNHLMWLMSFYVIFHSFLNTMGELMMFGDRHFYADWWNAKDVGTFWRHWNLPVHKWALRHLFLPVVRHGYNKWVASLAVFFLSAFLHEYLISVPLQMSKIFVFLGMFMQVPLIAVSAVVAKRFGNQWGNMMVWASLILGQPLGILVYFHDYAIVNFDVEALTI